jgi:uncharacterized protein with FMN-binding domain
MIALVFAVSGCNSLSPAQIDAYLDGIAVAAPADTAGDDVYKTVVAGPSGIVARQMLNVDGLSGASFSSKALIKAAENALSR